MPQRAILRVQYDKYCTPVSQSECRYFYKLAIKQTSYSPEETLNNDANLKNQSEPSGPNLDLLCIWQSNAAPFCEIYAKLYFDAKHLEKELNREW